MWFRPPALCRWLLAVVLAAGSASVARAQTPASCDTSYSQAKEAYYAADFETALALLRPCAQEPTLQDSTRAQMYRLLSFAYLGQNDQAAARRAVESLLDLQPTYSPDPKQDRPDFIALVRKAKQARRAQAKAEDDRRWLRWVLGVAAVTLGTTAALLLGGGGSGDGNEPLPRPEPPPE